MHTSSKVECPVCGSTDVKALSGGYGLYRCLECNDHFEEVDNDDRPPKIRKRRMVRHFDYEDED